MEWSCPEDFKILQIAQLADMVLYFLYLEIEGTVGAIKRVFGEHEVK